MAVGDVVQGLTGRAGLRGAARGHVRVVGQALASGSASSWAAVERHYIAEGRCSMSMEGGLSWGCWRRRDWEISAFEAERPCCRDGLAAPLRGGDSGWCASARSAAREPATEKAGRMVKPWSVTPALSRPRAVRFPGGQCASARAKTRWARNGMTWRS